MEGNCARVCILGIKLHVTYAASLKSIVIYIYIQCHLHKSLTLDYLFCCAWASAEIFACAVNI
jgi:hypothetical protein